MNAPWSAIKWFCKNRFCWRKCFSLWKIIFLLYLSAMRNLSRSASNTPESSLLSSASYNTAHSMSFATAQNVQQEVTLSPATQNQRHHQHRQQRHHDFVPIDSVDGKLYRCHYFPVCFLTEMHTIYFKGICSRSIALWLIYIAGFGYWYWYRFWLRLQYKSNGYIVICRTFQNYIEPDPDFNPNCQLQELDWNRDQNPDLCM